MMKENTDAVIKAKNLEIIDGFYKSNKTFVTKDDLINKGFDFSEWFSTSDLRHHFDNEENAFNYKDFNCGSYYVKTRDKNKENPKEEARLFFQIIKPNFERNETDLKKAIDLLYRRKNAAGSYFAFSHESEINDASRAKKEKQNLDKVNIEINSFLPNLKSLVDSLAHTHSVFLDLYERLAKKEPEDENWI